MRLLKVSLAVLAVLCCGFAVLFWTGAYNTISAGYPSATWPAFGRFLEVAGSQTPLPVGQQKRELSERGKELFKASESRVLLVLHKGELVLEHYSERTNSASRLNSYSLVKSLIGALVLKANAEGLIDDLSDPIGTYLSDFGPEAFRKRPISSFLEMRSGLGFERDSSEKHNRYLSTNPFGNLARLHAGGLNAVERQLLVQQGTADTFRYQNVNTSVLGRLLIELYNQPLENLLAEKIWQPAGAGEANWLTHGESEDVTAYCCLYATPRDWLKVGSFLARNGTQNNRFLPEHLWRRFFGEDKDEAALNADIYGLHIRHNILNRQGESLQGPFSYLMGQGGQIVYMMPEKDLVVVRFGEKHSLLHSTLYEAWNSIRP